MNSFVISLIRTNVPIGVGSLLAWLASTLHVVIDPQSQTVFVVLTVSVASSGWYALARLLEHLWPPLGVLLGVPTTPVYSIGPIAARHLAVTTPADPGQPAAGVPPPAAGWTDETIAAALSYTAQP